jgi:probable F420-dependent oxidoreductase
MTTTWYDPVATLSWIAGVTEHVRLVSEVYIVAYRHPLQTAKAWSTLDVLSGGRAVLGVGVGHAEGEFEALGVPFRQRGRITSDYIRAIRASFADEWGSGDVGQSPRPVQPGGPPIWVGGGTAAAFRRAAELGDGWLPQGVPEQGIAAAVDEIQRLRHEAGRSDQPFEMLGTEHVYVGEPSWDIGPCITGKPEQIAEALSEQSAVGVTSIGVRFPSRSIEELVDQIESFGRDVIPTVG